MFLHYIWDFDGTLFDSYPHMSNAFQLALKDLGVFETIQEILKHMKLSVGACIKYYQKQYGLGEELRNLYHCYGKNITTMSFKPYPYLAEVLQKIIHAGGRNYVYTHRDKAALDYIREFHLDAFFTDAITKEDPFPLKPAPDAILHLVSKHAMDKGTVLMIGDRDIDVLAGQNAGVEGCLFDPDNFFPDYQTKFRVESLQEFETLFLS